MQSPILLEQFHSPFCIFFFFVLFSIVDICQERTTTDDDVCENEEHDKSKEQEDFLPEKDRTEVNKALKEKDHDTQGNIISTEKHVRGSASKKKAALDKNNLA